ncbi:MAG: ribokinase [Bacteroidales bacterium]|jgi:ribokinase|nr:ribokinase [Bacteroidales bacterium]
MYKKNRILVIGSSNTDMIVKSPKLPAPGETVLGDDFFMDPGGKGANQAVAAARLGGEVVFICKVGDDMFGKKAMERYDKEKIDTSHIIICSEKPSGVALINVDEKAENCIVVASGANGMLSPEDVSEKVSAIEEAGILMMQLEIPIPSVERAAKFAKRSGAIVILNPAPMCGMLPASLFSNIDIIVPNQNEAEKISGVPVTDISSASEAAAKINGLGVKNVIITMGSQGAILCEEGRISVFPAEKVKAVDTTAAGDTFCGALCVALSEGRTVSDAISFANHASAIAVTRHGSQNSIPYRSEMNS